MRSFATVFLFAFLLSLAASAQDCAEKPKSGLTPIEEAAVAKVDAALLDADTCETKDESACKTRKLELADLRLDVLGLMAAEGKCAADGKRAGTNITSDDKQFYNDRVAIWSDLYQDMATHDSTISDGTYVIPNTTRRLLFGLPVPLIKPQVVGELADQTKKVKVTGQRPLSDHSDTVIRLYLCVWPDASKAPEMPDCTDPHSTSRSDKLQNSVADGKQFFIPLDDKGTADADLSAPLTLGEGISLVERSFVGTQAGSTSVSQLYLVKLSSQCNSEPTVTRFSDCSFNPYLSIIGGVEQAGLASLPSTTDAFLSLFVRAGSPHWIGWGKVRLLSAPQQTSTSGVVSAFTDPTGAITTTKLSSVGTSLDFVIGAETPLGRLRYNKQFTYNLIGGGGATTPLASNSVTQAFAVPVVGTVECNVLYDKFKSTLSLPGYGIIKNPNPTGQCLLNSNAPIAATGTTPATYQPVNTLAFSNQDRSNFLGKYFLGLRTIDRFLAPGAIACGDTDTVNKIAPCSLGIVDMVFGQDSSVTRGQLRHLVFKLDVVHPLPIKNASFLYLFGSFTARFERNHDNDPLTLKVGDLGALTGSGSAGVPNLNTVVLPLEQPDRDFYRFGVGLDAICLFKNLFSASTGCVTAAPAK